MKRPPSSSRSSAAGGWRSTAGARRGVPKRRRDRLLAQAARTDGVGRHRRAGADDQFRLRDRAPQRWPVRQTLSTTSNAWSTSTSADACFSAWIPDCGLCTGSRGSKRCSSGSGCPFGKGLQQRIQRRHDRDRHACGGGAADDRTLQCLYFDALAPTRDRSAATTAWFPECPRHRLRSGRSHRRRSRFLRRGPAVRLHGSPPGTGRGPGDRPIAARSAAATHR